MAFKFDNNSLEMLARLLASATTQEQGERNRHEYSTGNNPTGSTIPTLSVEQLFELETKSSSYIKEGKYEEAYGMVKKQYKLGIQINFVPVLVKYYVALMQTDRPGKAEKIRDEVISRLQERIEVSPGEAEKYASTLLKKEKYFEAILFYQIAANYCENESNSANAINVLHRCTQGMKTAVTELLEKHRVSKPLIKKQVIPHMLKITEQIGRRRGIDKKDLCFVRAVCLHHVEQCHFLVGDIDAREVSLKDAISSMQEQLGKDAEKRHIYGGALNNLGHTYLLKDRPGEAAKFFSQAIVAKQNAEDYDTEEEKKEDIEKSKLALQLARRQL